MTPNLPVLPHAIPDLATAEAFFDLYVSQDSSLRQRLAQLELQTLFLLLVDTLENQDHEYDQLRLSSDGESVWIELSSSVDPCQSLLIDDETEEIGARASLFMQALPFFSKTHGFACLLSKHVLTSANKWQMAEKLLGKEAASEMEAAWLLQATPMQVVAPSSRPRM